VKITEQEVRRVAELANLALREDEVARILAQPDLKAIYVSGGLEAIASSSPAEFGALIQTDRDKWAKVIKAANIRIE